MSIIFGAVYFCIQKNQSDARIPNPSNFNIEFQEGWGNGLEKYGTDTLTCRGLDTFENTIERCLGAEFSPHRIAKFILSQSDREMIRQKIKELNLININNEPIIITGDENSCKLTTHQKYFLKIQDGENNWKRYWDNCDSRGEINESYTSYAVFAGFMINLIESKDEFKKLDNDFYYFFLDRL